MSSPAVDGIIWVLLLVGTGFCGISVIGLLLFPDIRSRRYTAVRAGLIGFLGILSAVIVFGLFRIFSTAGNQYPDLVVLSVVLTGVIVAGNLIISRIVMQRSEPKKNNCNVPKPAVGSGSSEDAKK
jgi:multicomponent Na+:H+ antiporter subunit G